MSFKLQGAKELDEKLKALGTVAETKAVRGAMRTAMKPVMETAKATMPVGETRMHRTYLGRIVAPGFASRNLRIVVSRPKNGYIRAMVGVAREAFYAIQFFEFGTSKIPAHPWLVPAFESNKDAVLKRYTDALRRRIKAIAKRAARQ